MFGKAIFAFFLLLLATALPAQVAVPETPAGRVLAEWLPAINSGDRQDIQRFIERHGWDQDSAGIIDFFRQSGGLFLMGIVETQPDAVVALVGERDSDRVMKVTLRLAEENGVKKTLISLQMGSRPPAFAIPRLSLDGALAALDARADGLVKQDRLSGAMLIEHKGKVVYRRAWGLADREAGRKIGPDAKFRLGSMNKMFTAVAILQLADRKSLSLDDKIERFFPDYPDRDTAAKVTIRHLLTHTGGTGDIFGPEFDANRATLRANADYVRLYGKRAPLFEPGTQERYSNYGFILLGEIVAKVSGLSYYDYVERHIFGPAGMKNSGSLPEEVEVPGRVKGYMWKDGRWVSNVDTMPYRGTAAGGGYSTVEDLLHFARALKSGKLVSKALLAEATRFQTPGKWYGFGFVLAREEEERHYGHGGGAPGMNAVFRIYPDDDVVIVALSNLDPPVATTLADFFGNRMPID